MPDQDPRKYFGSEVKRLNYYNSQFLVAKDFNDEQLYHNQMRRLHNRSLHTWGVVSGLEVSSTSGAAKVLVAPGIAIDRLGREVVLPTQPDPIGFGGFDANSRVYVTVGYAEVFDPADKDEVAAQTTDEHYKRWTERPKVNASADAPAADAAEVLLAVVTLDSARLVAEVDGSARRYSGSRFGSNSDGKEFSLYADTAGAWHFFDGAKGADRLTVDGKGNLKIGDFSDPRDPGSGGNIQLDAGRGIFFRDNGQIRSRDDSHRILFRRDENKLELREFGDLIFSPGATNGNETARVTMLGNGNVGIGATPPATRLHVASDGDTELSLQSNDNQRRWTLQASGAQEGAAAAGYFQLIDRTAGLSRLTINTSGGVGIGTTDPGTAKLKIVSGTDFANFRFDSVGAGELLFVGWSSGWNINAQTANRHLYINRDANESSDVFIGRAGKELLVKGSSGNISIRGATNTPLFPLTFSNELGDKISLWGPSGNHYGFGIQNALLQIHSDTAGADIAFGYGSSASFTELMRVKGNGRVGIGTNNPLSKLHIHGDYQNQGTGGFTLDATDNSSPETYILRLNPFVLGGGMVGYQFQTKSSVGGTNIPLTFDHEGKVGIGTNTPSHRLQVTSGDIAIRMSDDGGKQNANGQANLGSILFYGHGRPTGNDSARIVCSTDSWDDQGQLGFFTSNDGGPATEKMIVNKDGNVGIGTHSPVKAKLEVNGSVRTELRGYGYTNRNGASATNDTFTSAYSIWASDRIAAVEFNAFSDERIKNVRGRSDGAADLRTLLGIEVTDYGYKDVIGRGAAPHKKVLAQQVEKVFPQAVSKQTDVVPDIYRQASFADGWVSLATDLKKGERVHLISDKAEGVYEVLEAEQDRFRTDFKPEGEKVFVFGREVDDFRTLDYDAIAMLNVSATQQLKSEKDEEVQSLRAEVEGLTAAHDALAKRLRLLEGVA